ncbi:MAG: Fic family protein [Proteobacteria bacterium]|nr:Fic family protein [Pseudomonadota bacterium]
MDTTNIKKEITELRKRQGRLVQVSNVEWYSLFKDEIRNSIAIEGVFTNRNDLIEVLDQNKRTDKQKAAAILGYFESASATYEYAVSQYMEGEFLLRMSDIRQIHTLLMRYEKEMGFYSGELGEFKNNRVDVTMSTFTPVNEFYVRQAMELLVKWVNHHLKRKTFSPVRLAAMAHVWFESIHPFRDGNGRSGRILLSYLLVGCGYINIAIKGVSKKDRNHYYEALEKADDDFEAIHRRIEGGDKYKVEDVDKFIHEKNFDEFTAIVVESLEDSVSRLKKIDIDRINKEALLPLSDLSHLYGYSSDYLRNLINRGKIKGQKKGKTWYLRVKDLAGYIEDLKSK